jgi:adenine-specific DNA methylase
MQIGPSAQLDGDISDYVLERFATKDGRDGSIEDHFGYEYPHRRIPSKKKLNEFHDELRAHWDGELPTVLDPTAGGGTIPLESLRYGLPTISNELNPVAWLLNKVILEYTPEVGSVETEVRSWMSEIEDHVQDEIGDLFPNKDGISPNHYFRAYCIDCPSCGNPIPVSNQWYFNRQKEVAIYPEINGDELSFRVIDPTKFDTRENYDPNEGTVDGGDITCPSCGVVTERAETVEIFQDGDFSYEVCAVRYVDEIGGTQYHSPTEQDIEAIRKAEERVNSDLRLSTILSTERYDGYYDRAKPYGITQWRDVYSPRQLISHTAYLQAFEQVKPQIQESYCKEKAEVVLTLLSFISIKLIRRSSRLNPMTPRRGSPDNMMGNNGFFFKYHFAESNLMEGTYSYQSEAKNVLDGYEDTVKYVEHIDDPATVTQGDAAELPCENNSIENVVMDPPYGDNIMYAEMADAFQVWFNEYLSDVFVDAFSSPETNKEDEAVENPVISQPESGQSVSEAARSRYEQKMSEIFEELHRVLQPGGTLTIYFTDKEVDAWDSLTMSIIQAGFVISATHTITSEVPIRMVAQNNASADSTLLLTCRKPKTELDDRTPTLWRDIKQKTREVASKKATELLESNYNLTKTDMIISAFGPTLQVFTQEFPVVDDKDNYVRPKEALTEARSAVTEVLINRELEEDLEGVDSLSRWYILSWLVYEQESIPYDEARQLGLGVGVYVDDIKQTTKIWGKSQDDLVLKGHDYRVRDYDALEAGEKRRKRAYPVDPRDTTFEHSIDAVHAALNVLEVKGGDFTWNWLKERGLHNSTQFKKSIKSLLQVLPDDHSDRELLINLASGETGDLLGIEVNSISPQEEDAPQESTLEDFN